MSDLLTSCKPGRIILFGLVLFTLANTYLAVMHLHKYDWMGLACDLSIIAMMFFSIRNVNRNIKVRKELDAKKEEFFRKHGIRL